MNPHHHHIRHHHHHRLLHACALLLALSSFFLPPSSFSAAAAAAQTLPFNQDWLFGGQLTQSTAAALAPGYDDSAFERVTLPHTVAKLSWQNWDYNQWQRTWVYRKHFTLPASFKNQRVFLNFEGVMTGVTPVINGHALEKHLGGFLPTSYELTKYLAPDGAENILAVEVDGRWSNVPPQGSKKGPEQVDYLMPAGITRQATLTAAPPIYLKDVYAKPVNVLDPATRRLEVACTLDAAAPASAGGTTSVSSVSGKLTAELRDGPRIIARAECPITVPTATARQRPIVSSEATDSTNRKSKIENSLTLANLPDIQLWSPDTPKLYTLVTTLTINNGLDAQPPHTVTTRIGFREAKFTPDGFFLNGKRLQIFGLNRHELFPYVGFAMPPRVMRHDAEILKNDLNLNFVRLSHYPQSAAFLDACDELGLLVWEEIPGWQYVGDAAWQDLLVRDIRDMVTRDRNRPSVVIWGTRVNESANQLELYRRTRAAARALDDTRPLSGSMHSPSRKNWQGNWEEDVFAYDDYHAERPGIVGVLDPVPGVPYFLSEAVGQFNYAAGKYFNGYYLRSGDILRQQNQALFHAQIHDKAAANPRNAGVVAWCAFEYGSLVNAPNTLKTPGVIDTFRIPKIGAAFYQTQRDPANAPVAATPSGNPQSAFRVPQSDNPPSDNPSDNPQSAFRNPQSTAPLIIPGFNWDFGPATPRGPGKHVAIHSNCDTLKVYLDNTLRATLRPDTKNYPNLKHPPFFLDLDLDGAARPELKIEGYINNQLVLTRRFSSDPAQDKFYLAADDPAITADGSDATRVEFRVTDKYGAQRAFATGTVTFTLAGPATIIGDTPFDLAPAGGLGAIWLRSHPSTPGQVTLTARHSQLGEQQITITTTPAAP